MSVFLVEECDVLLFYISDILFEGKEEHVDLIVVLFGSGVGVCVGGVGALEHLCQLCYSIK